ncbi:hypothetical protein [Nocardioides nitrophenolicus]|uniref:hypothetical protein n=1 Tax=Nocardioides nitrophenolicus TaxID=60489 RepID=UPI00195DD677|nr:hypothetical protein [Nocardioides nitrophenolicus]MBM7518269.1 hypothetical protein [Nocardioides nitrophenolicus]
MAVRHESVRLELNDAGFSTKMAKNAAATAMLAKELDHLDGTSVDTARDTDALGKSVDRTTKSTKEYSLETAVAEERTNRFRKGLREQAKAAIDAEQGIDRLSDSAVRGGRAIDQYSGRLGILLRGFAVLGPTLAPIATVGVAGVAGLASQLGFAATGALSLVVAAQGVGDALKAVNEAALEPTTANLEKAREAMSRLGPEAQAFVTRFQEIRPALTDIRDAAAAGWFPGLTESLTELEDIAPEVATLFNEIGTVGGNLVAEGAAAFAGPEWADFRHFVAMEAPKALNDLGHTLGNVAKGLAELWMAFGPLNSSFSSWLLDASRGFADWAEGLSQTEGFAEFVDYVQTNGPKVADAVVAIANAVLQIAEAAAPLGGPVLDALTSFANLIADIADSPLGTPIMTAVAAMSALSLATNVATAATLRLKAAQAALGMGGAGAAAKGKGALLGGPGGVALAGYLGNEFVSSQGEKAQDNTFDVNFGNSSPLNAIKALTSWDADKFVGSDIVKRIFTGPDVKNVEDMGFAAMAARGAFDALTTSVTETEAAAADLQARFTSLSEVLTKQGAFDAYQASLDSLTESVKRNGQTLDANTEAGRENRENLNLIAERAAQYAETLEGADRKRYLQGAIQDFKEAAEKAGGLDRRAREVLRGLRDLAKVKVDPKINVDTAAAKAALQSFKAQLADIHDKKITVSTTFRNFFDGPAGAGAKKTPKVPQIPGMQVPGVGADGTTVPKTGLPYADRHLYLLADGERVTSNRHGQVDNSPKALDLINRGLLNDRILGLANGGTTGKQSKNLGSSLVPTGPQRGDSILGLHMAANGAYIALTDWIKELEKSRDTLQSENDARQSLITELGDTIGSRFTTALFGNTDPWSAGGSLADAIGILNGDTAAANAFTGNVGRLQALGLDDPGALNALLSQADAATIANIAATATPEVIAQYEASFQARQTAVTNAQNVAMAAQTATLVAAQAATTAKLDQVVAEIKRLQGVTQDVGPSAGKATGSALKKSTGKGARNIKKGGK